MIYIITILWVCIVYMHTFYKLFLKYKIQPTQTCLHVFREDYLILNNQMVLSFHFQNSIVFCRHWSMVDWGRMRFHSFSLIAFLLLSCCSGIFLCSHGDNTWWHRFSDISRRHYITSKFLLLWQNPIFFWDYRKHMSELCYRCRDWVLHSHLLSTF